MDAATLKRAEELFDRLVDLTSDRRRAVLDDHCPDSADLRRLVERLLTHHDRGLGTFLNQPVFTPPPEAGDAPPLPLPDRIGAYEVVGRIGEGGMGTVLLGRQQHPRRTVALKVIKPALASRRMLSRFRHEAEILGQLHHPGIALIYEAGTTDIRSATGDTIRLPFFAMEHVEGDPLDVYARKHQLDTRQRLELFARVCDAVQHAHQKGVIHRDLKPENCLVEAGGQPKVLDFGIARATDSDLQSVTMQTETCQIVGTLSYMSPEQVNGDSRQLDTRSDVYALGVILYQLLTGRTPVDLTRCSLPEAARRIRDEEPARLTTIDRAFRGDIETIVSRALQKDKARRYQSAAELAADIRRYLRGEPILARSDSTFYVLRKTLERNRGTVAAALLCVVLLAAFAVVSFVQARVNRQLAADERRAREAAVASKQEADRQAESLRRSLYFSRIAQAQTALGNQDLAGVARHLADCPEELRNWEWHYLARLSDRSHATVTCGKGELSRVFVSRDGRRIVTQCYDGHLETYDAETRALLTALETGRRQCTGIDPLGRRALAADANGRITIRNLFTWERTGPALSDPEGTFPGPGAYVRALAWSPDESIIAGGDSDGTVRLWNAMTGEVIRTYRTGAGDVLCLAFTPDSALLAVGSADETASIWSIESGGRVNTLSGHELDVTALDISPDGRLLATGSNDADIRLWDMSTGAQLGILSGHQFGVASVSFSPDSSLLVSGGADGLVNVWSVPDRELVRSLRGHADKIRLVTFTADGREIISAGREGTLKWWSPHARPDTPTISTGQYQTISVRFSPDDRHVLSSGGDGTVKVWDVSTLTCSRTLAGHAGPVYGLACSPDGQHVASGSLDHTVKLWDADSGAGVRSFEGHSAGVYAVAFCPQGRRVASADASGGIRIWERATGKELLVIEGHDGVIYAVAFSRDGRRIASGSRDGTVKVWDAADGAECLVMPQHQRLVYALCFSPDGDRIASVDEGGTIRIWDADRGGPLRAWAGHQGAVLGVAYHPSGSRLVTCGADNAVRVWDAETGDEILTLQGHERLVQEAVFSHDGTRLASCSDDGVIRLWEARSDPR